MFVGPQGHFRPASTRTIRAAEATIFRADGTRAVIGTLGTIVYDTDGNAHVSFTIAPREGDLLRTDLAA